GDVTQRSGKAVTRGRTVLLDGQGQQERSVIGLRSVGGVGNKAFAGEGVVDVHGFTSRSTGAGGDQAFHGSSVDTGEQVVTNHAVTAHIGGEVAALDSLTQHGVTRRVGIGEDDEVLRSDQVAQFGAVVGLA